MQRERTVSTPADTAPVAAAVSAESGRNLPARRAEASPARRGEALMVGTRSLASRGAAGVRRGRTRLGHLASDVGQGTVEYVGLLLLMATILVAIVAAAGTLGGEDKIGKKVVTQIGNSIDKAGTER